MFNDFPDMLTPKDCMLALGVGRNTIYQLINSGELKAIRVGNKLWRISRKSLNNYAKNTKK